MRLSASMIYLIVKTKYRVMKNKFFLGLGLAVVLSGCSTTKNLHSVAVPDGSATAVEMVAKKGTMSEDEIKIFF